MFILTAAIALSAWILFSPLRNSPEISNIEKAKILRDFVAYNFTVTQPIIVEFGDRGFRFPDLVEACQKQLDFRLKSEGIPYKYKLVDRLPKSIPRPPTELEQLWQREAILTDDGETDLASMQIIPTEFGTNSEGLSEIGQNDNKSHNSSSVIEKNAPEYRLELHFHDTPRLSLDLTELKAYMSYNLDFIHQNDVPFFMTQGIFDMLLQPDLDMWRESHSHSNEMEGTTNDQKRRFSEVIRKLTVNIIAAEESGVTVPEIVNTIKSHMKRFEEISGFVKVVPNIQILNVSKRRAAANLLKNTTDELTFFYSTTMRPYADRIQGVPIRHLDPVEKETDIQGDFYGTEYQEKLRLLTIDTYNVTSFLTEIDTHVHNAVRFPSQVSPNLPLMADAMMKHYTIIGITEILDGLIMHGDQFNSVAFLELSKLVDDILVEEEHNWARHLDVVSKIHSEVL